MQKQAKKRVLILHGWESNSREHWFREEKQRLERLGHEVLVPDMPNSFCPKQSDWVKVIEMFKPDGNSILIGHSLGGVAVLRYLEKAKTRVSKAILIATPIRKLGQGYEPIENFLDVEFDWEKIKQSAGQLVVINQTEDDAVPLQHGKDLVRRVNGELVVVKGSDHFDTIDFVLLERHIG